MKERFFYWLCDYSYRIVAYVFWSYFLFIIALDVFNVKINKVLTFTFWLLLGFYLGYSFSLQIVRYMKGKSNSQGK